MLTLEEEYKERKKTQEFLGESYYILEKLDRDTISKIVDSMNSVEESLGKYLHKLRSLDSALNIAEQELTNLVSSKNGRNSKKTMEMLSKSIGLYQGLSEFLRFDLSILLKSRLMASARSNPEAQVGPKFEKIFRQALLVDKQGNWLTKLFSSSDIPYLNNDQFAKELCTLSFKELSELTNIGRVQPVISQNTANELAAAIGDSISQNEPTAVPQVSAPSRPPVGPRTGNPSQTYSSPSRTEEEPYNPFAPLPPQTVELNDEKAAEMEKFIKSTIINLAKTGKGNQKIAKIMTQKLLGILASK